MSPASSPAPSPLTQAMIALALAAGREILRFYRGDLDVQLKADASPVTAADVAAEAIILAGLAQHAPGVPVIAEEAVARGAIPRAADRFFLVDPLDGTKEFISRNGEFTVNIALIEAGEPVAGVVYAPAVKRLFWGEDATGAAEAMVPPEGEISSLKWRSVAASPMLHGKDVRVVASRSHRDSETERFLATLGDCQIVAAGSSLKFCLVAVGEADLYPEIRAHNGMGHRGRPRRAPRRRWQRPDA